MGFPGGSDGKESACNVGNLGLIPGSERSPGEGNGTPLQYSCLENPMDRGAWWATVYGVTNDWATNTYLLMNVWESLHLKGGFYSPCHHTRERLHECNNHEKSWIIAHLCCCPFLSISNIHFILNMAIVLHLCFWFFTFCFCYLEHIFLWKKKWL